MTRHAKTREDLEPIAEQLQALRAHVVDSPTLWTRLRRALRLGRKAVPL